MDILIKGMEMPKNYPYRLTLHSDGHVEEHSRYSGHGHYQAIPVPEHGDLVQLDDALDCFSEDDVVARKALRKIPVVLERTT